MGGAMLDGWTKSPDVTSIDVVSPHAKDKPAQTKVTAFTTIEEWSQLGRDIDIAVLAVKPAMVGDVCQQIKNHLSDDLPVLSVAAGVELITLTALLGDRHPLIRAMPNTPSSVGQGMTGYCFNDKIEQKHKYMTLSLLSVLGKTLEVADDESINRVTAISGCGPAYFYLFIEAIEKAGLSIGLDAKDAALLARQTFLGAAALMGDVTQSPADLRYAVAGPSTTSATGTATLVFQENQALESLVKKAISAACDRARDLGKTE